MELLYQDPNIIVCCKPVGLDSEHELPRALSALVGGDVFPIHRLDVNVGGVMVYARTKTAAAALSEAIREGKLTKEYVATVHGTPPEAAVWEDLLFKDSRRNKVFVVKKERRGVKKARLEFRRLTAGEAQGLVRIRLDTGRSHQIRVQFASRGFPLVGDHKYGSRAVQTEPMLYSCCLTFSLMGKAYRFEKLPDWATSFA